MLTYNGASWVAHAIESVLNQTHSNWFMRIIDDGSTDETISILCQYQVNYPNHIQVIALKQNSYPQSNTNLNLEFFLASEDFDVFTCIDQDDVAEAHWLDTGLELLSPSVKCVRCRNARYNESLTQHLYDYPAASQLFLTREVVERVGLRVDRNANIVADTEYLMRVEQDAIDYNYAVILTKPICQKMRIHGANVSRQKRRRD
jgi:glycosyltransferase involved in cell wall biosynthesis